MARTGEGKQGARALGCLLSLGLLGTTAGYGQKVTAVPKLDLNRFAQGWYEIARLPNKAEKKCVSNALQIYALGNKPKRFQVVHSCLLKDGEADVRNLSGRLDKAGDGRLAFPTFFPFIPITTKLLVIAVGPDYEWALTGTTNRKNLWVLSRTAKMDPAVLLQVESIAAAQGFKISQLETVVQGR